jgi:hypothetical protein
VESEKPALLAHSGEHGVEGRPVVTGQGPDPESTQAHVVTSAAQGTPRVVTAMAKSDLVERQGDSDNLRITSRAH